MLFRLLLLFTLVPMVELALLIEVGKRIHFVPTLVLLFGMGLLGAALARYEGLRVLRNIQSELAAGQLPGDRLIDALLIFAAGVLLVTPGFLTDLVGLLLLLPPVRALTRRYLKKRFSALLAVPPVEGFHSHSEDDLIDVEARPWEKQE